jgi:hypothetical protein
MKAETAISLIVVVMEALAHRKNCLGGVKKNLPMELLTAAFAKLEKSGRDTAGFREFLSNYGLYLPQIDPAPYHRRTNNQKSEEVEAMIRDLLANEWSKSAIARHLRVNRRVVIRVALEASQNAQD